MKSVLYKINEIHVSVLQIVQNILILCIEKWKANVLMDKTTYICLYYISNILWKC